MIIDRFDTDLIEISNLVVDISGSILDHTVNQELQSAHGIHHVLHTSNPVVCCDIRHFSSLRINPHSTLADMERIGQSIVRDLIALSQSGLKHVLHIILHQSVKSIDNGFTVCGLACSKYIPCRRICIVKVIIICILQLISFVCQICLNPFLIGA